MARKMLTEAQKRALVSKVEKEVARSGDTIKQVLKRLRIPEYRFYKARRTLGSQKKRKTAAKPTRQREAPSGALHAMARYDKIVAENKRLRKLVAELAMMIAEE